MWFEINNTIKINITISNMFIISLNPSNSFKHLCKFLLLLHNAELTCLYFVSLVIALLHKAHKNLSLTTCYCFYSVTLFLISVWVIITICFNCCFTSFLYAAFFLYYKFKMLHNLYILCLIYYNHNQF